MLGVWDGTWLLFLAWLQVIVTVVVVACGVGVLCENWIVDASNLFFLYFVWFIHTPLRTWFCCVCGGVVLPLLLFVVGAHGGCLGTLRR